MKKEPDQPSGNDFYKGASTLMKSGASNRIEDFVWISVETGCVCDFVETSLDYHDHQIMVKEYLYKDIEIGSLFFHFYLNLILFLAS